MKRALYVFSMVPLLTTLIGCSHDPSTTSADSVVTKSTPTASISNSAKAEVKTTVPAGTKLRVALLDAVSSDKSRVGDQFLASLTEPVVVEGKTVLAKGTKVRGRVVDAVESGRVKGRAMLELTLTQIVTEADKSLSISTKPYTAVAESTKKRDAAVIGGGAGLGAAIGAIAGGGKGAAIGAAVGGGAGTGTVLATKGKEIRFAPEHPLSFTLVSSVQI
jgi:hypothetical protein